MITPMTIWLCVAGSVLGLIALRLVNIAAKNGFFRHPIFDTGTEREVIWIPGDPLPHETCDDYDDDF